MPVSGLPPALEKALETFLVDNKLTSWRISGGDKFMSISMRFAVADISDCVFNGPKTYRAKTPSQVTRDNNRRTQWFAGIMQRDSNKMDKSDSFGDGTEKNMNNNDTCSAKVDCFKIDTQSQTGVTQISHPSDQPQLEASKSNLPFNSKSADQNVNTRKEDTSLNDSSVSTVDPDSYSCDVCGKPISTNPGTICWTCSQCHDFAFCTDCHKNSLHGEHHDQTQQFIMPEINASCYCRSCGYEFRTNQNKLYECKKCVDIYIICTKCYNSGIHSKHRTHLQLKTKKEFFEL